MEHSWAAFHSEVAPPSYGLYRLLGSFGRLGLYLCVGASCLCDPHTRFAPYALARPLLTYTWLLGAPSTAVATAGPSGFSVPAPWRVKGLRRRRFPPLVRRGATGRPDGHLGRRARPRERGRPHLLHATQLLAAPRTTTFPTGTIAFFICNYCTAGGRFALPTFLGEAI